MSKGQGNMIIGWLIVIAGHMTPGGYGAVTVMFGAIVAFIGLMQNIAGDR
ncbi:hypothetical protein [Paracoccus versutus]|nr:hypothetical protein [Paracoccus versutus]